MRIDLLPDDVLLEIFEFCSEYDDDETFNKTAIERWQPLIQVCRRWRSLVFRSPRRLNLQLCCTPKTPVKDTLDVWPALPLIIEGTLALSSSTDNVIAALGQSNRVWQVSLDGWKLEEVLLAMQVPFPELTVLLLWSEDETPVVIPDSFLGGSAPRLRTLTLNSISFPGLPKLLLSATHLVYLSLNGIPHSAYISPQAIVALIAALSSLRTLRLRFRSPQSRPDWESPSLPPQKRSILPTLAEFYFKGVTEYLEELLARIDTPQLYQMSLNFFNQIDFNCPQLAQFINCTPTLRPPNATEVHVKFDDSTVSVTLGSWTSKFHSDDILIDISCEEPDWQLSSIEQVCNWSLPPLSTVEELYIEHQYSKLVWKNEAIENDLWLQLLPPFTAVKDLYLSNEFAPGIAAALQELVGGGREVLPNLQNIFVKRLELSKSFQKNIGQFVAARQLTDHPIAISDWNKYSDLQLMIDELFKSG